MYSLFVFPLTDDQGMAVGASYAAYSSGHASFGGLDIG